MIDALPNPLLVLDEDERICLANGAAENFFQASSNLLMRYRLARSRAVLEPGVQAVAQARARRRRQRICDRRRHAAPGRRALVDLQAALMHGGPALRHRHAARALDGPQDRPAAHLIAARRARSPAWPRCWPTRSRIRSPAFAARRNCSSRRLSGEDRGAGAPHLRGDRPHPRSGRPDGGILRRAAARHEAGQHPCRAGAGEAADRCAGMHAGHRRPRGI